MFLVDGFLKSIVRIISPGSVQYILLFLDHPTHSMLFGLHQYWYSILKCHSIQSALHYLRQPSLSVVGPNQPTIRSTVYGTTFTSVFNTGLNPFTQYVTANDNLREGTPSLVATNTTDESSERLSQICLSLS